MQEAFRVIFLKRIKLGRALVPGVLAILVLSACSTQTRQSSQSKEGANAKASMPAFERPSENSTPLVSVIQPREIIVKGVKLKNTEFDFPITINSRVEMWMGYFTGKGRKHFEKYLERSELFIPFIKPILREKGLPEDLVYLAMIESGFNNHAKSHAKAVGPWQFISATGKRYGLGVNWWVDERRDTRKSTIAAAGYLKDLFKMFNSWELAAAGYNAGEMKVVRAIRRYGTQDFWALSRQNFFRPETRDYVPKIIAAALVAKNREQFGFKSSAELAKEGEAVAPDGEVVKLEDERAQSPSQAAKEALESVLSESSQLNIAQSKADGRSGKLSSAGAIGNTTAPGRLEDNEVGIIEVPEEVEIESGEPRARTIATPHVNRAGKLIGVELLDFEVKSPADLMNISKASGLSYHTVKSLNPELLRWCTPPTKGFYQIRLPATVKDRFLKAYNSPDFYKKIEFLRFRTTKQQALTAVARHFGLKVDPLADLNGMNAKSLVRKGVLLKLPIPVDRSRNIAALEIRDPPESRSKRSRPAKRKKQKSESKVTLESRSYSRSNSSFYR